MTDFKPTPAQQELIDAAQVREIKKCDDRIFETFYR